MREEKMREFMQQELAVPKKVHDGFERGMEQVFHMDMGQESAGQKAGKRGRQIFRRRAALVAAAVAAICVIGFHSQIYSFAKSLFIHDMVKMGKKEIAQESDTKIIKIKDGVLTAREWQYFESLDDLGEKLGISFLKSPVENDVTGKGRVTARMDDDGIVTVTDDSFVVHGVSRLRYTEDGTTSSHIDSDDAYIIYCEAMFYTKAFQDDYETEYEDGVVVEEYETAHGFHATLFQYGNNGNSSSLNAFFYCDNIRYEYKVDDWDKEIYTIEDFKAFLDTLTK